jgi:trehalose/maltose hydrolase-like predicted phosphorylase
VLGGWPDYHIKEIVAHVTGWQNCAGFVEGDNFKELKSKGCESVQSGIPYYLGFNLRVGNETLDATVDFDTISHGRAEMSYFDGTLVTAYTWSPNFTNVSFDVEITTFASRVRPNLGASEWKITPRGGDVNAHLRDILDGRTARRSFLAFKALVPGETSVYVAVHPEGVPNVTAVVASTADVDNGFTILNSRTIFTSSDNDMIIGQEWGVEFKDGQTAKFQKVIGIATTDHFSNPLEEALSNSTLALNGGFDGLLVEHKAEWNRLMAFERLDDYRDPVTGLLPNNTEIQATQTSVIIDRYYDLQDLLPHTLAPLNNMGVSVGGLASDSYGGQVFWDGDFWVFFGVLTDPGMARQMLEYRVKMLPAAKDNAQDSRVQSFYRFSNGCALYPWVSGRFGNETAAGPAVNYQTHLGSDIAFAMFAYRQVTSDDVYFRDRLWPVIDAVAYTQATILFPEHGGWSINNVTDPDEYANHKKNAAWTLVIFSEVFRNIIAYQEKQGLPVNETWRDMMANVNIQKDPNTGITLAYEDMPVEGLNKQAAI